MQIDCVTAFHLNKFRTNSHLFLSPFLKNFPEPFAFVSEKILSQPKAFPKAPEPMSLAQQSLVNFTQMDCYHQKHH